MKIKISLLLLIVSGLLNLPVWAQDSSPVKQSAQAPVHLQLSSFFADYNYSPFTYKGKDINIQQVSGSLTLPVFSSMKNGKLDFLIAGVGYSGLFLSGTGNDFGGDNFHTFSVPLIFQKAFSPKYALVVSFIPTLSSDLQDVSGEDMTYTGLLAVKVRKSAKFTYSVGAVFSKQFFGTVLVPVIGIDWKITDKLSLSGNMPISEKLNYQLSAKSAIGINNDFGIGGGSYRLSKKMNSAYFQAQQFKSMVYYQYMLAKSFSVTISGGYNFTQKLDLYDKDQKVNWVPFNNLNDRTPITELKKTGIAVQTGINYRF